MKFISTDTYKTRKSTRYALMAYKRWGWVIQEHAGGWLLNKIEGMDAESQALLSKN
jgi:hypothetical protein